MSMDRNHTPESEDISLAFIWESLPEKTRSRLAAIKDLRRRGLTIENCAKILKVSPRTLFRDLKQLRELHKNSIDLFAPAIEIAETIELCQELEDRCMNGYRAAMEDHEALSWVTDSNGQPVQKVQQVPDHSSAQRYLSSALAARKYRTDFLLKVGLMKAIPERLEITQKYDVSKLNSEELKIAMVELDKEINETQERIKRINGPDPLAEFDHLWEN